MLEMHLYDRNKEQKPRPARCYRDSYTTENTRKATTSVVLYENLQDRQKLRKEEQLPVKFRKKSHQKKTNDSDPEQKLDQRTARKHRVDASGRERWTRLERTMSVVCLGQTTSHIDSRTLSHVLPV